MWKRLGIFWALLTLLSSMASAQSTEPEAVENAAVSDDSLLTQAELENLVAPVALYPDTLLIQIVVASTNPMQVIKSDRLLTVNAGEDPETIKAAVEAEDWDESVEVLAVAFPEVIQDMALHIEWTETMGDAMLAQSDDVMAAVQTMRSQAINSGALISGEEQTVEVTEEEDVVIQPTDPEVVYVPQYDPEVVYVQDDNNVVGDALTAGLIAFGTFTLIDAIFDDDDNWNNYWGCRNCGGWGGGPIYRNPDIDIDIDGNVNIGNNIGSGNIGDRRPDVGWKPNENKSKDARDKIASKKDGAGKTKLPVNKSDSKSDALRNKLSGATGAPDISRPGASVKSDSVRKTMSGSRDANIGRDNIKMNRPKASKAVKPAAQAKKPAVKKPAAKKAPTKKASKPQSIRQPKAIKKNAGGNKARKASSRGKASGKKMERRG
ncbi:MAG: DUF3300 domain-containing protein [Paracoccaceae bacterium]